MRSIFEIVRDWFRTDARKSSGRGRRSSSSPGQVRKDTNASGKSRERAEVSGVTAELLQELRSAPESRVKGPVWSLPRVTTGDPQPMLKHQADCLMRLSQNNFASGIIHLPTGSGKTRVGIEIAAKCLQDPQPGLFVNSRDDWAETCLHTGFSDRAEYQCVFPSEENFVCKQGSSKGASIFMNSPG